MLFEMQIKKFMIRYLKSLGYQMLSDSIPTNLEGFLDMVDGMIALTRLEREDIENMLNGE